MKSLSKINAVVIGRNEGARLQQCLAAFGDKVSRIVYVDSGSTDGSVEAAQLAGAETVQLDTEIPFTAARARNAGLSRLSTGADLSEYVQFVDGDCELQPGWIDAGRSFLDANPDVAVVCGRRRERFPDASRYNRLIDAEWNTPIGETRSCGGDALMRCAALAEVDGFDATLIAGEEPELCVRLRQKRWKIWRLDAEMTLHDAAITRFTQWWRRARRAGHAFAQGAAMHGAPPERHNVIQTRRALIWGAGIPFVALFSCLFTFWGPIVLMVWPLQIARLIVHGSTTEGAVFLTIGKIPEALGVLSFYWGQVSGKKRKLIEYK